MRHASVALVRRYRPRLRPGTLQKKKYNATDLELHDGPPDRRPLGGGHRPLVEYMNYVVTNERLTWSDWCAAWLSGHSPTSFICSRMFRRSSRIHVASSLVHSAACVGHGDPVWVVVILCGSRLSCVGHGHPDLFTLADFHTPRRGFARSV